MCSAIAPRLAAASKRGINTTVPQSAWTAPHQRQHDQGIAELTDLDSRQRLSHALGLTGGPGRAQHRAAVRLVGERHVRRCRDGVLVAPEAGGDPVERKPQPNGRGLARDGLRGGRLASGDDERGRPRVPHDIGNLIGTQMEVDRCDVQARPHRRPVNLERPQVVLCQQRNSCPAVAPRPAGCARAAPIAALPHPRLQRRERRRRRLPLTLRLTATASFAPPRCGRAETSYGCTR
jgi:hypothetical protein